MKVSKTESLTLLEEIKKIQEDIQVLENKQSELKEENTKVLNKIKDQKNKIFHIETSIQEEEKQLKQKEMEKAKSENQQALLIQEKKNREELINKLQQETSTLDKEIEKSPMI